MTSRQLHDLTPQELLHYAQVDLEEAEARARARAAAARPTTRAEALRVIKKTKILRSARLAAEAAAETEAWLAAEAARARAAAARAAAASTRLPAVARAAVAAAASAATEIGAEVTAAEQAASKAVILRAQTLAHLDISHKERMLGRWPAEVLTEAVLDTVEAAMIKASNKADDEEDEIADKQKVKKHMGSMLGDWDRAGKLSKRRIRKNIRKTKTKTKTKTRRRRHKNTKRR